MNLISYRRKLLTGLYYVSPYFPEGTYPGNDYPANLDPNDAWTETDRQSDTIPLDSRGRVRTCNELHKTDGSQMFFQGVRVQFDQFVPPATKPTDFEYLFKNAAGAVIPVDLFSGNIRIVSGAREGDSISIFIRTKSNMAIPGVPAGVAVKTFVSDMYIINGDFHELRDPDTATILPANCALCASLKPKDGSMAEEPIIIHGEIIVYKQ